MAGAIPMGTEWLPPLLQAVDPLFPTGAYAHSLGLEELVRMEVVKDEETLRLFLLEQVAPALEHFELPMLRLAHDAACSGDIQQLCALDRQLDAWKICQELREASLSVGGRRLQALRQLDKCPLIDEYAAAAGAKHHLVVYALQMRGAPVEALLMAWHYQSVAGYCSAALKLIRIGQEACQRVLHASLANASAVVASALVAKEIGWFNPLLEIASMRHQTAFERLFIS